MKKKTLISIAVVVVLGAAVLACWSLMACRKAPDPLKQRPIESVKYIASSDFTKLPEKERQEYFEKLTGGIGEKKGGPPPFMKEIEGLPENERKAFFQNMRPMFEARMLKEAKDYFSTPDEQKAEYLDKIIDRFEERRNNPPPPPPDGAGKEGGGPPRGPPSASMIKERIETTDPGTRALREEFFKDLHARMKELGIERPKPPSKR